MFCEIVIWITVFVSYMYYFCYVIIFVLFRNLNILFLFFIVSLHNAQDTISSVIEKQIETLELKGKKKLIDRKADRLIFNIENYTSLGGADALDALKITPNIKVQNDKISIIGKGNVLVMINNRPSQLSGDDLISYLKNLKSDEIKKIEVITNPPSKYTAEGNSGIINIVLKSTKNNSWNTSIRSVYNQSTYGTGSVGGNFNLQKNRIILSSSINYLNGSYKPVETSSVFYPNITWTEINKKRTYNDNFSARVDLDYKISDNLSTGLTYNYFNSSPLIKDFTVSDIVNVANNKTDFIIHNKGRNSNVRNSKILNYHIIYDLDSLGKKLSIDFDYFNFNLSRNRVFTTEKLNSNLLPYDKDYYSQNLNLGNLNTTNVSVTIDMEHPTKFMSLNYGIRFSSSKIENDYKLYDIDNITKLSKSVLNDNFSYLEKTMSYYLSINKNITNKWELNTGLRLEQTSTEGVSKALNIENSNNYIKLFPTFYVMYTPNNNHTFSINYGRRINRPNYNHLNPFRWISSPYSYTEGNPLLKPSFINNLELEYSYKDNIITNLYYSNLYNGFDQITVIDSSTNIQQTIPKNFIKGNVFGITQTFIYSPFNWLNTNFVADIYYSSSKSHIPNTLQFLKGWNSEFKLSNDIILNRDKTITLNIAYRLTTKGVNNLDYTSFSNQLDSSINILALNKKLVISINANDILSSNRTKYTTFSNNIKNTIRNYYDTRSLRLSILYNWGKKFKSNIHQNKNKEEINRLQ